MKTTFKNIKLMTAFKGIKPASWDARNYNHYIITVRIDNKRTSFDYWRNMVKPKFNDDQDLLIAFQCFVNEGVSAMDTFESFCSELGYDVDSIHALKTYKACDKSYQKLHRLLGSNDAIESLNNELLDL